MGIPTPPPRKANGPPLKEGMVAQKGLPTPQELGIPTPTNRKEFADYTKLAIKQKNEERRESIQEKLLAKKEASKFQAQASKETLPYYTKILDEDKAAKKIDLDTARMIKLIEKGNLPNPILYKMLKDAQEDSGGSKSLVSGAVGGLIKGGGVAGALGGAALGGALGGIISPIASLLGYYQRHTSPDTEEFEKLSANFISGVKNVFGGRISNFELQKYLESVPQLTNTDTGKKAIIRNIQLVNKAAHVRADAMKKVIKENDGIRPIDLALRVEEIAEPELDRLAKEFIG
jgi:hypothetical protein